MNYPHLDRLSQRLRRPVGSLLGLSQLSNEKLARLEQLLDHAQHRQFVTIRDALTQAFPALLRRYIVGDTLQNPK